MKLLLKTMVAAVAGLAGAGVVLAVLIPALFEAGYVTVGSNTVSWTIGGVVVGCVALAVIRPWRYVLSASSRKSS